MNNYVIIRLDETGLEHLYALYEAVYGKKQKPAYYQAKYATAYTGVQYMGFIALYNNVPVAYYGLIPLRCSIGGQAVLAAQSCDTMTHPEHRQKGLFTELALLTFALAKENGIHFVFGFPNQNSYPGFIKKLGFVHQETLACYTLRFRNNLFKKVYRRVLQKVFTRSSAPVPNIFLDLGFDGVIYDQDYRDYKRYAQNFSLEKNGNSFWLNLSAGNWVGAMSSAEKGAVDTLVRLAKHRFQSASLSFMFSPGTELTLALSGVEKKEGFALILKDLSQVYDLGKLKFQFADIDLF